MQGGADGGRLRCPHTRAGLAAGPSRGADADGAGLRPPTLTFPGVRGGWQDRAVRATELAGGRGADLPW